MLFNAKLAGFVSDAFIWKQMFETEMCGSLGGIAKFSSPPEYNAYSAFVSLTSFLIKPRLSVSLYKQIEIFLSKSIGLFKQIDKLK